MMLNLSNKLGFMFTDSYEQTIVNTSGIISWISYSISVYFSISYCEQKFNIMDINIWLRDYSSHFVRLPPTGEERDIRLNTL